MNAETRKEGRERVGRLEWEWSGAERGGRGLRFRFGEGRKKGEGEKGEDLGFCRLGFSGGKTTER